MTQGISVEGPRARDTAGWLSIPLQREAVFSELAVLAATGTVVLLFAISPVTLESAGIPYLTSGGGILSKFHPATFLAAIALALRCLAAHRPLRAAWRIATDDAGTILMLGAVAIAAFYAVAISHTPVTPLIDSFLLPVLVFLLLRDIDPHVARRLALIIGLLFCLNAVLAILEVLLHKHFPAISVAADASPDPTRGNSTFDWRAQLANDPRAVALFGHPLTDGLLTGTLLICFAAEGSRWIPAFVKVPVGLLLAVSMPTYGARLAIVLTSITLPFLGARHWLAGLREGRRLEPLPVALVLCTLCILVVGGFAVVDSGLADQTIQRFQHDSGSATTRVTMFEMFTPFSWGELMLGPDPDAVATQQRLQGLEFGIESSWIGLVMSYGLVVTAILMVGLLAFSRSLLKLSGPGAGLVLLLFFIQMSGAAGISTKTTVFAMTTAVILMFLRKDLGPGSALPKPHGGAT